MRTAFVGSWLVFFAFSSSQQKGFASPWELEKWDEVPGIEVRHLTGSTQFHEYPSEVRSAGSEMEPATDFVRSGSRIRGMFTAPETADYQFWIAGDDRAELSISEDGTKWSRQKVAFLTRSTWKRAFRVDYQQSSEPISLVQGQTIFLEVLHKTDLGSAHFAVGWSYGAGQVNWTQEEGVTATQSSTYSFGEAALAIDGNRNPEWAVRSVTETNDEPGAWWEVDLGVERKVDEIKIWNRNEDQNRLSNFRFVFLDELRNEIFSQSYFETSGFARALVYRGFTSAKRARFVRIEFLGESRAGNQVLSLAEVEIIGRPDQTDVHRTLQVLPVEHLSLYGGEPNDLDRDELKDEWELEHGFDPSLIETGTLSAGADPDRDGLTHAEETLYNFDPFEPESLVGHLRYEFWDDFPYYHLGDTLTDHRYFGEPDQTDLIEGSSTGAMEGPYFATRLRGYFVAPSSGEYRFWVSAKTSASFYLSSVSGSKYHKKKIAELSTEIGSLQGVSFFSQNLWDRYSSQLSDPIVLQEGETYFFEVLHQQGHGKGSHVSLAWAPPGADREPIPTEALSSYYPTADDVDDDFLPDTWESDMGLDPQDNGSSDMEREGERGDYDGDGLTNLEEYVLGTHPTLTDSDGDSFSDYDEVYNLGTDPNASNDITPEVVSEIDLTTYTGSSATWEWFDGGLIADNFRGDISWDFSVPSDGYWLLEVTGRLRGTLRQEETLTLVPSVGGRSTSPFTMRFRGGNPSIGRVITPWLTAGSHQFSIYIDNRVGRRSFQIQSLRVIRAAGLDSDGDGQGDWITDRARSANDIYPVANTSFVSPAFLEGRVRYQGDLTGAASTGPMTISQGLSGQHWYSNVALSPTGPTSLNLSFEGGTDARSLEIGWQPWEAFLDPSLDLRIGDELLLIDSSALPGAETSVTVDGSVYLVRQGQTAQHQFASPGTVTLTAQRADGSTRSVNFEVYTADFESPTAFFADRPVWRNFPAVSKDLFVDSSPHLLIRERKRFQGGKRLFLLARQPGSLPLAARLFESGPIVSFGSVTTMGFSDALRNDAAVFIGYTADGARVLQTPLVVTDLPPGGYVKVTIFKAGVTFLDGTRTRILTEADFDDGVAYLEFRYPAHLNGGYCHYVDFYDADGNHLGRH
ncbi:MAG: PA14 domain-containing protein [Verrucomicrobiota bacterium]